MGSPMLFIDNSSNPYVELVQLHLGKPMDPKIWEFIRPAARKLMDRGMPVGTLVSDAGFAAELLNDGFSFVACGSDAGLLAKGADNLLASVKGKLI